MVVFHVLRCAQCETFQVLQVTKSKKWKCKLCGQKQSVIKVFGEGTGAECRHHVQKLNTLRGQANQILEDKHLNLTVSEKPTLHSSSSEPSSCVINKSESRWSSYLDDHEDCEESELSAETRDNDVTLWGHVTTDWGEYTKRKREFHTESQKRKVFKQHKQQNVGEEFSKDILRLGGSNLLSARSPQLEERIGRNRKDFQTTSSKIKFLTEASTDMDNRFVEEKRKIYAMEERFLKSPYTHNPSSIIKANFSTPSFREKKSDSSSKNIQRKVQTKPNSTVSSKWAVFLNGDESEEEEEASDGFEDQLLDFNSI